MLTLIHYPLCPQSRSIRLALGEWGIKAALEEERPWEWREDFLGINPAGHLPVLKVKDGPTLCGVYAVSEYLDDTKLGAKNNRTTFQLFPGDNTERAEVRRLVDWFHLKFHTEVSSHLLDEKIHYRFKNTSSAGGPDIERLRAGCDNIRHHLHYIGYLAEKRNWLGGNELSFADLASAAHLSCIDYLGDVPWDENPAAKNWYARIKSRRSFRPLLEENVPGVSAPDHYANLDF